jgi:hypothetical protein
LEGLGLVEGVADRVDDGGFVEEQEGGFLVGVDVVDLEAVQEGSMLFEGLGVFVAEQDFLGGLEWEGLFEHAGVAERLGEQLGMGGGDGCQPPQL